MKIYFSQIFRETIFIYIFFIGFISFGTDYLRADQPYFKEEEINSSTKLDNNSDLPTNPFEIVEMIRRANSMNDATSPSDAIDNALKSFQQLDEEENI